MPRKFRILLVLLIFMFLPLEVFAQTGIISQSDYEGKIIREIKYEGLKRTKEYIVTRELISKLGNPCLQHNLEKEYKNLESIDVFSQIQILPTVERDSVFLTYKFVETFPILPAISLKISDENGLSAGGGVKSSNLLGKDIFFSGRLVAGGELEVELLFENPWITGNHLGYRFEYYHRERNNLVADFVETADEFYLWIGSHLSEKGRIGGSLAFLKIHSDRDGVTLDPGNTDYVSRIGAFVGYDSRDSFSDTRVGWWNEIAYTREIKLFKNASNFNQIDIDFRRYQPLPFWDRHKLALFSLLTLRTGIIGQDVAPWQLFGIGGTNTVRGWKFASRNGKNQVINTVEYRVSLFRPRLLRLPFDIDYRGGLQFALFGDMGIGWTEAGKFADKNFIGGGGFGIRFLIPIFGMARVDFGWGESGRGVFLHLGTFEKPVVTRKRVR